MWLGMSALKYLYLYNNGIAALKPGDLDHLPMLERLLLDQQSADDIKPHYFQSIYLS